MKITLCGSMTSFSKMQEISKRLKKLGHKVNLPLFDKTANYTTWDKEEAIKVKLANDAITVHYNLIKNSDAILVVNEEKKGVKNYVGGNSFLEIGFAFILKKKIFLLNDIPELSYTSEIVAMKPICLNGKLELIR
ncbi:MAG: hypothetical protein WC821_03265 [archaeon]|jgi:predicted RNA-binding protein with PUA domain